jgi:NADPH:quinone reductase-like Zn-dependent oxidoreductase
MVMGQALSSTTVIVGRYQCVKMPNNFSFEEAASIPIAFSTAIHGLTKMGRLQKDETVLIHSACESVGLAAFQLAQKIGAKVR